MREVPRPNPMAVAFAFGSLGLAVTYLAGPIRIGSATWLPEGIVSWATLSRVNPVEDYVWFASCLIVGLIISGVALVVYHRRGRLSGLPAAPSRSSSVELGGAIRLALAIGIVLWVVHAAVFNVAAPITYEGSLQPLNPAGMRFDPFHDGERLGFLPTVLTSAHPLSDTFFIHGFGVDTLAAVVGTRLLPGVDPIIGMRIVLLGQLVLTAAASLWVLAEVLANGNPIRDRRAGVLIGLLAYLLLARTVYPHLLLSLALLALVLHLARPETTIQPRKVLVVAAMAGGLVPLGLLYSYTGLVVSVVMVAVGLVFVPRLRSRRGLAGLFGGGLLGTIVMTAAIGPDQVLAVTGQVIYWIQFGAPIWDRPPTVWIGPADVLLPALLAAMLIQLGLLFWIGSRRIHAPSWRAWLERTRIAWVLLAFAAIGTRDALDRAGFDYGERAFATSLFGLVYLVAELGPSIIGTPRRRWLAIAGVVVGLVASQAAMTAISLRGEHTDLMPADFELARNTIQPTLADDACVFTMTSEGLWYYALGRPSCSRFHEVTYGRTNGAQAEIVADLAAHAPPVIVFSADSTYLTFDDLSVASTNAEVTRWVLANYRPSELVGSAWLWRPGSGPSFDLAEATDVVEPVADHVQQGSEMQVDGDVAPADGSPGDGVYLTVDGATMPVAAAPVLTRQCGGAAFTIRLPTFDLGPGTHAIVLWLVHSRSSMSREVAGLAVTIEPRTTSMDLGGSDAPTVLLGRSTPCP